MFRIIVLLVFMASASGLAFAQEAVPAVPEQTEAPVALRNPFESQLPRKEEPVVEPEITTPSVTTPQPVQSTKSSQPEVSFDPTQYIVHGMIWNTDRPQAIINQQILNIGDVVNGAKIVSIQKTGIDLSVGEKIYTIKP